MKTSVVFLTIFGLLVVVKSNSDERVRETREIYSPPLVQPFGGTFKLIIGFGIPIILPGRSLSYGQNMQFQYILPDNATFFSNLFSSSTSRRRRRSSAGFERKMAYTMLERQLDRSGVDGKECLMRGICEAAETPLQEEGLVGEVLHLLLTPDYGGEISVDSDYLDAKEAGLRGEDCAEIFASCPQGYGLLDLISTIKYTK